VTISSMSAMRGMRGLMTAYVASKAGLANMSEGIRSDSMNTPICVSTIYPDYILTDLNKNAKKAPFRVDLETGCRAMVKAFEKEVGEAHVPWFPWVGVAFLMRILPLGILRRLF
jgi:NAD(P)-dependent dehydrogenase (short-subunit alcohol dehydrogenase family)